jgi:hypothetical protein
VTPNIINFMICYLENDGKVMAAWQNGHDRWSSTIAASIA